MHGPTSKGQPSLSKEMMRIYKEEGVRAFWKGNAVTIVHRLPYSALNFFSYEKYKAVRSAVPFSSSPCRTGCHVLLSLERPVKDPKEWGRRRVCQT